MGTKRKPGRFDCYDRAEPDEPMFTLLGRDRHAPMLVTIWAALREADQEDPATVAEARECAKAMIAFRLDRARLLADCERAIEHAIFHDDGLDAEIGEKLLARIRAAEVR